MNTPPERVFRPLTAEEKASQAEVRGRVMKEFPPTQHPKHQPESEGIAAKLRAARKARGLSYEVLATQAGLPGANTVKDVEYGRNTNLHDIESIAHALGMKLELVAY